jgi:hypothetical protein
VPENCPILASRPNQPAKLLAEADDLEPAPGGGLGLAGLPETVGFAGLDGCCGAVGPYLAQALSALTNLGELMSMPLEGVKKMCPSTGSGKSLMPWARMQREYSSGREAASRARGPDAPAGAAWSAALRAVELWAVELGAVELEPAGAAEPQALIRRAMARAAAAARPVDQLKPTNRRRRRRPVGVLTWRASIWTDLGGGG